MNKDQGTVTISNSDYFLFRMLRNGMPYEEAIKLVNDAEKEEKQHQFNCKMTELFGPDWQIHLRELLGISDLQMHLKELLGISESK